MQQVNVKSRMIESIHFSQEDGKLRVCFVNGAEKHFTGVPAAVVSEMVSCTSPGNYYLERVRNVYRRAA